MRLSGRVPRPRHSTVAAYLALFVALGGVAVAAGLNHKEKKQVRKIAKAAVTQRAGSLVVGRSNNNDGPCNPSSEVFVNCVTVSLKLPRRGRVLLIGDAYASSAVGASGRCRFGADGAVVGGSQAVWASPPDVLSHTAVSQPLASGKHSFQFGCNDPNNTISYSFNELSAVMIGSR